jgi:Zn-dependent M28 family amino/carboxypeptidase
MNNIDSINLVLITITILLLLIIFYYLKDTENFSNLGNSLLNQDSSMNFIKNFTKEISVYRPVGSKELKIVKNKIINEMKKIGLKTEVQSFKKKIYHKEYSFSNLIGKNINANKKFILLGVHIDSPQIDGCESTIDAATGVSIALELARRIISKNPNFPLMLLFIDGEEAIDGKWSKNNTLTGSRYFVNNYDLDSIHKVYIFDLIGGDIKKNKIAAFSNNQNTHYDINRLANINKKYDEQIFLNPSKYISNKSIQDDHVPFLEKNKFALNLITFKFPDSHHTLNDNYNNVNWKYVEIFYKVFYEFLDTNARYKN